MSDLGWAIPSWPRSLAGQTDMQMRHLAQESGTLSSAHPSFLATVNLAAAASPRRLGSEARLLYTCSNDLLSGLRVRPAFLGLTTLNGKEQGQQ